MLVAKTGSSRISDLFSQTDSFPEETHNQFCTHFRVENCFHPFIPGVTPQAMLLKPFRLIFYPERVAQLVSQALLSNKHKSVKNPKPTAQKSPAINLTGGTAITGGARASQCAKSKISTAASDIHQQTSNRGLKKQDLTAVNSKKSEIRASWHFSTFTGMGQPRVPMFKINSPLKWSHTERWLKQREEIFIPRLRLTTYAAIPNYAPLISVLCAESTQKIYGSP